MPSEEEQQEEGVCERSRQKQSMHSEDREDSIFDKHFFGSEKEATPLSEQQQEYSTSVSHLEVNNPISLQNGATFPHLSSSTLYKESKWNEPNIGNFKLKESTFKDTEAELLAPAVKASIPRIDNPRSSEENLFTPLELLNECRNFLKHRGDSSQKSNANSNISELLGNTASLDLAEKQESIVKERPSVKKEEDSGYVFPEIKDSSKKS